MMAVCTGHGASDTHALVLNDGRQNPHPSAGTPYGTISPDAILAMVKEPPTVAKELGQWIVPSTYCAYDARSHEAQRLNGAYAWMAADIDQGDPSLADVDACVGLALGDVWTIIYSSRSAKPDNKKWRVLIPLKELLTGREYGAYQAAFFDALEAQGLTVDRTLERAGQLIYLPNRGEFYQWQAEGNGLLDARSHPMAARAKQYMEVHDAAAKQLTGQARQEGNRSHLAAFRRKHSIEDMLRTYGYERKGLTSHWRSPLSASGSYSTQDRGDHWISLSHNDAAAGLGKATSNGSRYGDAFDLYVYYQCGGNYDQAEQYARQCLVEEDDQRYGEATPDHGAEIWANLINVGSALGPKGNALAVQESARKLEELKTPEPEIIDREHEWDVPWPPGVTGEIAKHIYRTSSRPVKQFAIAMALYIMSGMAGQRYNVEGFGLNLYMMIAADSGSGKGEARRGAKRIYGKLGLETQDAQNVMQVFDNDMPASASGLRKLFADMGTRAIYREDADAIVESLTNTQPGSNGDLLRAALSQFWDQSGEGLNMGAVRYAKAEDSTEAVVSPSLTLGVDLQVDPFKRFLGHGVVLTTGIGARFIYVTRYGKRRKSQKNRHGEIPQAVIDHLTLIWQGLKLNHATVVKVNWETAAKQAFEDMDDEMVDRINAGADHLDLLNRAHINAARVAACVAVGHNHNNPTITLEVFNWARQFVLKGYAECTNWIESGLTGSGERVRVGLAIEAIKEYVRMKPGKREDYYKAPRSIADHGDIIHERYFIRRLGNLAAFKGTDNGATTEDIIRKTLRELCAQEYLVVAGKQFLMESRGIIIDTRVTQQLYVLGTAL